MAGKEPHVRLSEEQVKQLWSDGLITVSGLIYLTIRAKRKDGWGLEIPSVQKFCDDQGISRSSWYRAIGRLTGQGLIEANERGSVVLTVVSQKRDSVPDLTQPVSDLAQSVSDLAQSVPDLAHATAETQAEQGTREPPRSLTDLTNSFSGPPAQQPQKQIFEDDFEAWLFSMAAKLPRPPKLPRVWVAKVRKIVAYQEAYRDHLAKQGAIGQAIDDAPQPHEPAKMTEEDRRSIKIAQLKARRRIKNLQKQAEEDLTALGVDPSSWGDANE